MKRWRSVPIATTIEPLAGYTSWYNASAITGLNDNDPVTTWNDDGTLACHIQAALTERPTYQTNVINGRPAVEFDGSNDLMTGGGGASYVFPTGYQHTVFIVLPAIPSPPALPSSDFIFDTPNSGSVGRRFCQVFDDTGTIKIAFGRDAGGGSTFLTFTPGENLLVAIKTDGTSSKMRLNGDTGRQSTWTCSTSTTASADGIFLGRSVPGGSFFTGHIAELIVYPSAFSDSDFAEQEARLKLKYGIS